MCWAEDWILRVHNNFMNPFSSYITRKLLEETGFNKKKYFDFLENYGLHDSIDCRKLFLEIEMKDAWYKYFGPVV